MQSLWFNEFELKAALERTAHHHAVSVLYHEYMSTWASSPAETFTGKPADRAWNSHVTDRGDLYLVSCSYMYLVTGDSRYSARAFDYIRYWTDKWITADVTIGHWTMHIAAAYECCCGGWTPEQRIEVASTLRDLIDTTFDIQRLSPHVVTNNHWAISYGAAAVAAMAIDGAPVDTSGDRFDATDAIELCLARIRAFLGLVGEQGAFHEGASYLLYSFTTVLPAILALQRKGIADLASEFPCISRAAQMLYALVAARPVRADDGELKDETGMMLSWNNCPVTWDQSHVAVLLIHLAPEPQRGALKRIYNELRRFQERGSVRLGSLEPFFGMFYYPFDQADEDPDTALPHHLCDTRHGLTVMRQQYRGAHDTIAGLYCRTTGPSGGNTHDDAGSVRIMSKGHDWIMGGGQLRPAARYQSIMTPHGMEERPKPYGTGTMLWNQATGHGGVAAVDLRNASRAYHERYMAVDWSGGCGTALSVALLDLIEDHEQRAWDWNMTFEPGLEFSTDGDGAGFSLVSDDGWEFGARFVGQTPGSLTLRSVPAVTRQFTSGFSRDIAARPLVCATFGPEPVIAAYVLLTVTHVGTRLEVAGGQSVDVRIGTHSWIRPFGGAVPARFSLQQPCGIFSKYPSGTREVLCARFSQEQQARLLGRKTPVEAVSASPRSLLPMGRHS